MDLQHKKTAIVIGAGIVGLASARALALGGYRVTVYERHPKALGASIRNFGMVWPVGQPAGLAYETAIRSRDIWRAACDEARIWYSPSGSLHLAYNQLELDVMQEFADAYAPQRGCRVLTPTQTLTLSEAVNPAGLAGALWSQDELVVDPRQAIPQLAAYLQEQLSVDFRWGTAVTRLEKTAAYEGDGQKHEADLVIICSGADFETLYPEIFRELPITKCKLQMMRLATQPQGWRIGPSLCGSLSALHYSSFKVAASLPLLRQQANHQLPDYGEWGIHVMVSQNGQGELTIGDSHEYGLDPDPFDRLFINELVMDYLKTFAQFKDWHQIQSWNGVYAKMTNGDDHLWREAAPGVYILNATGGAGMTLSFGLAERIVQQL